MKLRLILPFAFAFLANALLAQPPNKIWSYAIGDWRDGPVVTISPLFETTEAFTTPMLIKRVKQDYAEFANIMDIDVMRFATMEEGELSRTTLKGKYEARKLTVNMLQAKPAPVKETAAPDKH
jgi:hypothetical protein